MDSQSVDHLNEISDEDLKLIILIHSALAGASVAAVIQISGRELTSLPLLVALSCFAITIPFSLLVILLLNYRLLERARWGKAERHRIQYWPSSFFLQIFRYITYTASFGGFLALFWNFHAVIGLIFLVTSAIAMGTALAGENYWSRQADQEPAFGGDGMPLAPGKPATDQQKTSWPES